MYSVLCSRYPSENRKKKQTFSEDLKTFILRENSISKIVRDLRLVLDEQFKRMKSANKIHEPLEQYFTTSKFLSSLTNLTKKKLNVKILLRKKRKI